MWDLPGPRLEPVSPALAGRFLTTMPPGKSHQCLFPHSEPQPLPASTGDPPVPGGRSGPGSHEVTAFFPWVLVHLKPCVCPPRVEFLFPAVLWNSCGQTPLAFKARFSGNSFSCFQTPRLGSLTCGSELSLLWENFCDIIIFQFVGCPPGGYGI